MSDKSFIKSWPECTNKYPGVPEATGTCVLSPGARPSLTTPSGP